MTDIVMTKETKPRNPILKKYVKRIDDNRFKIEVSTNLQEIGMQGYERYTRMSDGVQKIEPEIFHDELSIGMSFVGFIWLFMMVSIWENL